MTLLYTVSHENPIATLKKLVSLSSYLDEETGSERLNNLPQVRELRRRRTGICYQVCLTLISTWVALEVLEFFLF